MSSDLWAAFGEEADDANSNPWAQPIPAIAQSGQALGVAKPSLTSNESQKQTIANDHQDDSDADSWSAVNQELEDAWNQPVKQTRRDGIGSAAVTGPAASTAEGEIGFDDDFGDFEQPEVDQTSPNRPKERPTPSTQLPDLDPLQVEDDFGDFEEAEQTSDNIKSPARTVEVTGGTAGNQSASPSVAMTTTALSEMGTQASFDPFADLERLSQSTKPTVASQKAASSITNSSGSKVTKPRSQKGPLLEGFAMAENNPDPDEEWDDLSEPQNKPKTAVPAKDLKSKVTEPTKASQEPTPSTKPEPSTANVLPPTNVPPPSILMPLVSSIVQDLPEEIETILKAHEDYQGGMSAITQTLGVLTALEDRMSVLKVAARIIAGRKLRWKRDGILSQSMRISAAGRPGGMKLTGVDKAETQREDREASEFVRMWKANSGRIRGAVMKMPAQIDERPPALPQIAKTIPVRNLKEKDGGIKAPKCCVLCGLKREERVDKVDGDVWDQFGEWWTDHWGHTECRNFWNNHEQFLQQR